MTKIIDIGCDDFDAAARNREMIRNKDKIINYLRIEAALRGLSLKKALPVWIPTGTLPVVNKKDWHQFGGEPSGLYEATTTLEEEVILEEIEDLTGVEEDVVE